MRATFTPGPWFALGHTVHPDRLGDLHALTEIAVCKFRRVGPVKISAQEAHANARLIAAAPELYAWMRKELADYDDMGHDGSDCDCVSCVRVAEARAILTRIDGEDAS